MEFDDDLSAEVNTYPLHAGFDLHKRPGIHGFTSFVASRRPGPSRRSREAILGTRPCRFKAHDAKTKDGRLIKLTASSSCYGVHGKIKGIVFIGRPVCQFLSLWSVQYRRGHLRLARNFCGQHPSRASDRQSGKRRHFAAPRCRRSLIFPDRPSVS